MTGTPSGDALSSAASLGDPRQPCGPE